mgnify:FL=1|tara:strand:- start:221 stop:529 length:309 start_codon:yes stop_codon:yes gene_type:complete
MYDLDLERKIEEHQRNIKEVKENINFEEKKVKIQLKYPKPLNPQYEFELRDEYLDFFKKIAWLEWKRKKQRMMIAIKEAEEDIKQLKKLQKDSASALSKYTA